MRLNRLEAYNYRRLERIDLTLAAGFNLLVGANASGKTSTLLAIEALAGSREATSPILAQAGKLEPQWRIGAEIVGEDGVANRLSLTCRNRELLRELDDSKASLAEQARALALLGLNASGSRLLLDHGNRRRQIDWLLFHVEPAYARTWSRYARALQQRNHALRARAGESIVEAWEQELAETGEKISQHRQDMVPGLQEAWSTGLANLGLGRDWNLALHRGWSAQKPLLEVLHSGRAVDRERGSTQHGPHLAQLRLTRNGKDLRERVSGGESRLVELALLVALGAVLERQAGKSPLLLLDDITAELDARGQEVALALALDTGWQLIATALEDNARLRRGPRTLFHVEQGGAAAVVE